MKVSCDNNPETKKLFELNLPSISHLASHQHYQKQKRQRKNIEKKRKVLEETVAILKRQAEQTNKRLKQTQDDLMFTYNKKLTTLEQKNKKIQFDRAQKEQLQQKRNFSNLTRYLHSVKKQENNRDLSERKKNLMRQVKSTLQEAHSRKKRQNSAYMTYVYDKARKMSETNRSNVRWAQQKTLQQKHKISKTVRNSLIQIEQSRIAKQAEIIEQLQRQKQNIMDLLQRNRQKHNQVQDMRQELVSMDLYAFESRIVQNKEDSRITDATRRISRSRNKSKKQKNYNTIYY